MRSEDSVEADCPLDASVVRGHVRNALESQQLIDLSVVDNVEISIQLLDSDAMRHLNHQYRNVDKPTNVLSFESGMPALQDEQTGALLVLGDVVFCPEVIASEALEQGKSQAQHWAHMIVHGILHLCVYEHTTNEEASIMESLEVRVLSMLGVSNPYQIPTPANP